MKAKEAVQNWLLKLLGVCGISKNLLLLHGVVEGALAPLLAKFMDNPAYYDSH